MPFTTDEITEAVESIVLSSIRRPYDTLGVRRTDVTFTDVQEAAAGVFLLNRNAPFYVLLLAGQRVVELAESEAELVLQLVEAVIATGRDAVPVEDLTNLANARAALLELEGAVGARTQAFKSIEKVPAFVRFQNNVDAFLSSAGSNVKASGQIVQTPQEARAKIPSLLRELEASHQALIERVKLLQNGISDFNDLNLPSLVALGAISRSRALLTTRLDELEALTPEERLVGLRSVVLELLTQKGVVKQFGSFAGASEAFDISGTGTPYSDVDHLATAAKNTTAVPGSYPLRLTRNTLDFFLDADFVAKISTVLCNIAQATNVYEATLTSGSFPGVTVGDVVYCLTGLNAGARWTVKTVAPGLLGLVGDVDPTPDINKQFAIWPTPSVSLSLAPSLLAKIEGFLPEPYDIHTSGGGFPATDTFEFKIDLTTISVSLTLGVSVPAATLVSDINAAIAFAIPGSPVVAESYFSPLKYDSQVAIAHIVANTYSFTVLAGNLDGLGIVVGDTVRVTSGPDAGTELVIGVVGPGPTLYVEATAGGPLAASGTRQLIQIGSPFKKVRLVCNDPAAALSQLTRLEILNTSTNTGSIPLGFGKGLFSQTRPVRPVDLVKDFNQRTTKVVASNSRIIDFEGSIHTDPLFPQKVVAYKLRGTANLNVTGIFSINVHVPGVDLEEAGIVPGDIVAVRSGADINEAITVVSIAGDVISGTMVAVNTASGVDIEIGPGLPLYLPGTVFVEIPTGINAGIYEVISQNSDISFEFTLTQNLPQYKSSTSQPLEMQGQVGQDYVVFSSINRTTASKMYVRGSAAAFFYVALFSPVTVGSSPWFQLPEMPLTLQATDVIETYPTQYNDPTTNYEITSVESALKVVGIEPEMPSNESWPFSLTIPVPFARLKAGTMKDTTSLSDLLSQWLLFPGNQDDYFIDLNRFVNPLLVNSNPTPVQVNDALTRLTDIVVLLTSDLVVSLGGESEATLDTLIEQYQVDPVPAIDTLIKGFLEKGADRAVDILLTGNFSGFFGMTANTSSYAGNMLDSLREMAREDLPVSKFERLDAVQGKLLTTVESPDFEFSSDDIEEA